jgi:hypothetical protein
MKNHVNIFNPVRKTNETGYSVFSTPFGERVLEIVERFVLIIIQPRHYSTTIIFSILQVKCTASESLSIAF